MTRTIIIGSCLLLAGCANTAQVRALSDSTGTYVASLKEGTNEFVDAQTQLNTDNESRLQTLGNFAAANRAEVVKQQIAWSDAADARRTGALAQATQIDADNIVDELKARIVRPPQLSFGGNEGYGTAATSLAEISKGPDVMQSIRGLLENGEQVLQSIEEISKGSTGQAKQAGSATAKADSKVLEAGSEVDR